MIETKTWRQYLILLLLSGVTACNNVNVKSITKPQPVQVQVPDPEVSYRWQLDPITIAAVGDIMLGTDFPDNRLPDDDGVGFLDAVKESLKSADISFGNLEGVLLDGGEPFKVCKTASLCYLFRTPTRYAQYLRDAGFDVLSLANNHARDFGEEGRTSTMQALDNVGIFHSGRQGDIASWSVKGYRVAMIAFAPHPDSYSLLDIPAASALIQTIDETHDLIIVSFHGGAEGQDALHLTFAEEFFYEQPRGDVVAFSRAVVDAGADLVFGHGPHVVRAMEIYKDRLIAYSLGNFATYYGISVTGLKGIAPIVRATLDQDGRFLQGDILSTIQVRPNGPRLDPDQQAFHLLKQLSTQDLGTRAPKFDLASNSIVQ